MDTQANQGGSGVLRTSGSTATYDIVEPTGGVLNFAALAPAMNNANAVPIPLSALGQIDVFGNGDSIPDGTPLTHVRGVILGDYD